MNSSSNTITEALKLGEEEEEVLSIPIVAREQTKNKQTPVSRLSGRLSAFVKNLQPRVEIVYTCQIVVLYTVIVAALVNLSLANEPTQLWLILLSSCLGYTLPAPSLNKKR